MGNSLDAFDGLLPGIAIKFGTFQDSLRNPFPTKLFVLNCQSIQALGDNNNLFLGKRSAFIVCISISPTIGIL